ncbi:MAG: hypothetical protein U9R34_08545 [Nanoarchaeota archaeon]|nr:hypothetical protein [Nanoarchaeota archaeon]
MIYDSAEDYLLLKKTNFDEKVLQLTKKIPKGRVSTYKIIDYTIFKQNHYS